MRAPRRLLTLTFAQLRLLLAAAPLVVAVRIALVVAPYAWVRRMVEALSRPPVQRDSGRNPGWRPEQIGWAVGSVARRVPGASCLTRALAMHFLLRRCGHPSELCLGAARGGDGGLEAHAWVECGGRAVIDGDNERFTRFA